MFNTIYEYENKNININDYGISEFCKAEHLNEEYDSSCIISNK